MQQKGLLVLIILSCATGTTAAPPSLPPGMEEAVREYGNILFCECYEFINIILWKLRLLKQARIWN